MTTLTVTSKGQVTLRKEVLRHLGVAPGDKIAVDLLPSGRIEVRAARSGRSIEDFFGCLHRPGERAVSLDEIKDAASEGWAGER